jgi:uncharacterized membrane protein YkoI
MRILVIEDETKVARALTKGLSVVIHDSRRRQKPMKTITVLKLFAALCFAGTAARSMGGEAEERGHVQGALEKAKITLQHAVEIAQKEIPGGKPYAAELELKDDKAVYEVKLLVGGKEKEVKIDAVEGKVLGVEDEEEEVEGEKHAGQVWNFDKDATGKLPEGWSIRETHPSKQKAVWEVTADPTAHSKPNVLSLVKTENTGGTFNLIVADKTSCKDLDLSVRMKANSGKEDQGGGLIWRAKDENNYYICRNNPLESNFRVYKVVNGRRTQFDSADVTTEPGKWYTLRATMVGDRITCYLDGKKLLEAKDDTFKDAGMIGFWTKADAASSFDDLVVRPASGKGEANHEKGNKAWGSKEKEHGKTAKDDDDDDDGDH